MTTSNPRGTPNFLIVMTDEHGPMFSGTYGHPLVRTPNMDRLARQGVTFRNAYCNSPLCVPSRLSFMTGRYVHHIGAWDNGSPLPSDTLTWPYLLRARGYDAVLCGKMHLIGPDKLHGFRDQLALELHGAHPHFIPEWDQGLPDRHVPWEGALKAGPGTTREIEVDDLAEERALAYLSDQAHKRKPFALCVGFIAPHFPLVVPERYYSMYYPDHVDLPDLPPGHLDSLPPAARRLQTSLGMKWDYDEETLKRARAAYYGLVTYVDEKLGRLLDCLEETGLAENTFVIHTSDHGDHIGEHGLWRKMSFYEQAARVPFQIAGPGVAGGRQLGEVVSLVDVVATVLDLAAYSADERRRWRMDGDSLAPLLRGEAVRWKDEAFAEYTAHGTDRPRAMVRSGRWKLCYNHGAPPEFELYDLEADPGEFVNRAGQSGCQQVQASLLDRILAEWGDPDTLDATIRQSQRERNLIRAAQGPDELLF